MIKVVFKGRGYFKNVGEWDEEGKFEAQADPSFLYDIYDSDSGAGLFFVLQHIKHLKGEHGGTDEQQPKADRR